MSRKTIQVTEQEMAEQREAARRVREIEDRPKSYFIVTYGCQMNAHDSEILAGMMDEMGMTPAAAREEAELILFNTCCIRDNAERKALGNMTWLKELKRQNPRLVLCACGCMIQQPRMAKVILRQYPFFDIAFGTHNLHKFPSILERALETRRQVISIEETDGCIAEGLPCSSESKITSYLSIMYGCNNFCSYCIVPYVRGRERSRSEDDILREAERLLEGGTQEIMLLGQNVNSYGNDRDDGATFPGLIRRLDALGVPRLRFMTSHPKDLSSRLIDAMAELPRVCKHIHLPVQSGSSRILKLMNRCYTREKYIEEVQQLREKVPEIELTTDIIVGFPGETEADFKETLSLVEQVGYSAAYTFMYSPRKGTVAATMPDQIPDEVKHDRLERLNEVQSRVLRNGNMKYIGTYGEVLVEGCDHRSEPMAYGKLSNFKMVYFPGDDSLVGSMRNVKITGSQNNSLVGELV